MQQINITKVVTRNFVVDFFAGIQNFFGKNLTGYEKMIDSGTEEIWNEVKARKLKMVWYRYQLTQLSNDAVVILFYGEAEGNPTEKKKVGK